MAFDQFAFSDTLDEIEKLLGYLWGNERAFLYLRSARSELIQVSEDYPSEVEGLSLVHLAIYEVDDDYRFPCPDPRYAVKPVWTDGSYSSPLRFPVFRPTDEDGARAAQTEFFATLKANANLAYQQGIDTAAGTAEYCRSVCAAFTKVRPDVIAETLADLQGQVLAKLQPLENDDWALLDQVSGFWTGLGASSFSTFYHSLDSGLGRCYYFGSNVVAAFGMLAMLSHGAQVGAQKYVESVRDNLEKQLAEWVDQESRPAEPPTSPPWLADFQKIFGSAWAVVGDLPVASVVTEQVDKAVGVVTDVGQLISDIADVSGHDFGEERPDITLEGPEMIYDNLTGTLYSTYYKGYLEGLEQLFAGDPDAPPPADASAATAFSVSVVGDQHDDLVRDGQWSPGAITTTGSLWEPGNDYPR